MDWILIRWRWGVAVRLVLGVLWGWSSWVHLRDPHTFLRAVQGYDITPEWLTKAIAYGMPVLGLCLAVLLIIGMLTRYTAAVSAVLLLGIFAAVVQAWIRGLSNASGFLGSAGLTDSPRYPLVALLPLVLLAASAYLVMWPVTAYSVDARAAQAAVVPEASARAMRSPRAAQRYRAQAERRRRQVRNEQLFLGGSVAVLVALICVIGAAVQSQRAFEGVSTTAAHATAKNGVVWGVDSAPATVDLYEDYKCTQCETFQQATAAELKDLVYAGKLRVRYHPIAYIETGPDGFSSRASNAALCASDISVDVFVAFHNVAFGVGTNSSSTQTPTPSESASASATATESALPTEAASPSEAVSGTEAGTPTASAATSEAEPTNANTPAAGTTLNDTLLGLGTKAQINDAAFTSCVSGNTHKQLVNVLTDEAMRNGVSGAPTAFVNGSRLSFSDAADLRSKLLASVNEKADAAVAGGKVLEPYTPAPTASSTPTPEAS